MLFKLGHTAEAEATLTHLTSERSLSTEQRALVLQKLELIDSSRLFDAQPSPESIPLSLPLSSLPPLSSDGDDDHYEPRASARHQAMDRRVLLALRKESDEAPISPSRAATVYKKHSSHLGQTYTQPL